MSAQQFISPYSPALDANAQAAPGAKLTFYLTGTTTPAPVYADSGLTTLLTNPVVADAAGRFPSIYLDDSITYRVVPTDALGAPLGADTDPYITQALHADNVSFNNGATGAVERTVEDKLRELPVSAMDMDAAADGSTNDSAAFTALSSQDEQFIPAGSYNLTTSVTWPDQDYHLKIDVGATFNDTTKLKLGNVLKYHDDAQWVLDATRKAYGADYANTWTVFQFAQRVDATANLVKAVALYGQGIATVSGAKGWGMNCAGSAEVTGASAIGAEITALSNATGTTTTALSLEGKGTNANTAALQITTGGTANAFAYGFNVSNASDRSSILSTGTLFEAELTKCLNGFHLDGSQFSGAEYSSGNLLLGTSDGTHTARPQLKGNVGEVGLSAKGYGSSAATTASVNISTLGNAALNFYVGGEKTGQILKLDNSTGTKKIGFFGATPVAKQTATDLAGVIAALQAYGLLS